MIDYKIWKPEYDGHAPPNWREGLGWDCEPFDSDGVMCADGDPAWWQDGAYKVPAEALNSPNDDASGDVDTWKQDDAVKDYNSALIENVVKSLRQLPAEELAKHGITLAPEKDWATELWADLLEMSGRIVAAKDVREGRLDDDGHAAIELLRTRFEQMIAERGKRDGNA